MRHPKYPLDAVTAYFNANLDFFIEKYKPKFWLYGHNHWSDRKNIGSTELVSNQLGYPGEQGIIAPYNKNLIIDLS